MNDLIASNKRRTALLLVGFVALVVVVGISVGSLAGNGTGSLIVAFGMSAVFALLIREVFGKLPGAPDPLKYAFLGALIG